MRTKLAVILHADVVGSTGLVQEDERLAHERIQGAFRRLSEVIATYGGIAHELRGDALVAEFERASDAVSAALAFQSANTQHNTRLADAIRPEVRVGIALGEVVVADGTMTGAGVVLSQRLEQLAETGGVVVQGAVSEAVPARLPFVFRNLGEQTVKGFESPIRAYVVGVSDNASIPAPEMTGQSNLGTDTIPSPSAKPFIAVLPFINSSPDPEHAFFSDGITEDIITELSRFQDVRVLARASAFGLREKPVDVDALHYEFGVDYVLEGSVRRAGNRVRITAELSNALTGHQVWTERYDRELLDVFELQDEITRAIVAVVPDRLGLAELERSNRQLPNNLSAYDCLLRAKLHHHRQTPEDNAEARRLLERAIELHPEYAAAHGWLGCVLGQAIALGYEGAPADLLARVLELVRKGLYLDENDVECHRILCEYHMIVGEWDEALRHHEKALSLNPNDPRIIAQRGELFTKIGDPEGAIEALEIAMTLDPFEADSRAHLMGRALFAARRYDEAVDAFRRIPTLRAEHHADIAACFAQGSDTGGAERYRQKVIETQSSYTVSDHMAKRTYKDEVDREHHYSALVKAGFPE